MSISPELFMAILSMDSYNRGYDAGIKAAFFEHCVAKYSTKYADGTS